MSAACDIETLEALVAGELPAAAAAEALAHAGRCTRCAHELAWLRTERELFEQRACRERLVNGLRPPAPQRRWRLRVGLGAAAIAALVLVMVNGQRLEASRPHPTGVLSARLTAFEGDEGSQLASVDPQWVIASLEQRMGACLLATPGEGPSCGASATVPASFGLAGR